MLHAIIISTCMYVYFYIYIAEILGEIKKAGFETPTPIQVRIIMLITHTCRLY